MSTRYDRRPSRRESLSPQTIASRFLAIVLLIALFVALVLPWVVR